MRIIINQKCRVHDFSYDNVEILVDRDTLTVVDDRSELLWPFPCKTHDEAKEIHKIILQDYKHDCKVCEISMEEA